MVIYDCTLKVKKTLRGINQISKNSYSTYPERRNHEPGMEGQLTIREDQDLPPLLWQDRTRSSLYQRQCLADDNKFSDL